MTDGLDVEALIREALAAQALERAATLTIDHYGPELLGFTTHLLHDSEAGAEAFAAFSEVFWRSLPRFEGRCSMRSWVYKLARHAALDHGRRERRKELSACGATPSRLSAAVERVRTSTAVYQRTDVKDRFAQLRRQLSEEEQTLLMLRVDRELSWRELAEVLFDRHEHSLTDSHLASEAARLRKRYQLLKQRIRKLLEEQGAL